MKEKKGERTVFRWISILAFFSLTSFASNRPLKAIPLKEGNKCGNFCRQIFEPRSIEANHCMLQCQENSRVRGGFPLDLPKLTKTFEKQNSNKL